MFDRIEDTFLEKRNALFWRALLGHVQADGGVKNGSTILDVGCHRGGLLENVLERFRPSSLIGIEPMKLARDAAVQRLSRYSTHTRILSEQEWLCIDDASVDLVLSHEVLPFFDDLDFITKQMCRVLKPGAYAYMVSGCHLENPLWPIWRADLEEQGHQVYDHYPVDLMKAAGSNRLESSVRPLRETGWAHYNPVEQDAFTYPSVESLLDHQFKHKLIFRFHRMPL